MVPRPDHRFALTESVVAAGLAVRAYPAASIEVGRGSAPLWQFAGGRLAYDGHSPAATTHTIFDLASLTKVVATTSFAMQLVDRGVLDLDAPVGQYLDGFNESPWPTVTVRHLLDHSSGLPAHARLWEHERGRDGYRDAIRSLVFVREPGAAAEYSDLGFILLGFVLEALGGSLRDQMRTLASALGTDTLGYLPAVHLRERIAPTEFDLWRNRLLAGEVHDENAAALDGVAAHAGLFGTASDVGAFARVVLDSFHRHTVLGDPTVMRRFAAKTGVPASSRALGWDTMLPTSSCGSRLSPSAIGHTGFTGTSLWIDWERDLYVVFLTNRVYPTRSNDAIRAIRRRVHEAVIEDLK